MFTFIEVQNLCRKSMRQKLEVMKQIKGLIMFRLVHLVMISGILDDIWMSTYGTTEYPLTNKYETWSELNQQVLEKAGKLGGKTRLLGISLKKVTGPSAKITEFNLPKRVHNIMSSYEGFRFGKVGDFFSSQDIYMYMSGQEVQFRTFSGDSAWQGEIS